MKDKKNVPVASPLFLIQSLFVFYYFLFCDCFPSKTRESSQHCQLRIQFPVRFPRNAFKFSADKMLFAEKTTIKQINLPNMAHQIAVLVDI